VGAVIRRGAYIIPGGTRDRDMSNQDPTKASERDGGVKEKTRSERRTDRPRLWKVLLHNDDYTPMEFVVAVLVQVFHKDEGAATTIMLRVHNEGIGVAGLFPHAVAETKVAQVLGAARSRQYPLMCSMEPE
jgi:ATP-dependent Clp protease adaptor protein ClpS